MGLAANLRSDRNRARDRAIAFAGPGMLAAPHIAGARIDDPGDGHLDAVDPSTGESIYRIVQSSSDQVDAAVSQARTAGAAWMGMPAADRGQAILRWGERMAEHLDVLSTVDAFDMGKVVLDSVPEYRQLPAITRYWAGFADKIRGTQIPTIPGHHSYTVREPVGVVAVLLPWNGPTLAFVTRVATDVACGNAVVVKPSEHSSLSAQLLVSLAVDAGFPPGLISVVTGDGRVGELLTRHPAVDAVDFTGSVSTGRKVAAVAAESFKRTVLEMGGKAPSIVFGDADVDAAVRGTAWGAFRGCGQACLAPSRILVHETMVDEFVDRLVDIARRLRIGDPLDRDSHLGPLAFEGHLDRVQEFARIGADEGATPILAAHTDVSLPSTGYFATPLIFTDVRPEMRIAQEEIFGPVATVLTFDDEAEAVAIANGVEQGLSANVWTSDLGRMLRLAEALEVGNVLGNTIRMQDSSLPFGGHKASGNGINAGDEVIESFTKLKRVTIRHADPAGGPGWDDADLDHTMLNSK